MTSPVLMSRWKWGARVWAKERLLTRIPASVFGSRAFGVGLAEVTNTRSLSWMTALAWSTAAGASPGSTERGRSLTSARWVLRRARTRLLFRIRSRGPCLGATVLW